MKTNSGFVRKDTVAKLEREVPMVAIEGEINEMPYREAMGLPHCLVESPFENSNEIFEKYRLCSKEGLVEIVESSSNTLKERYIAASILGFMGDSRISALSPPMIHVPEAEVVLGLSSDDIESVYSESRRLGVLREWIKKETPVFRKRISAFKIAKYPVTNYEYAVFLRDTKCSAIPGSWAHGRYPFEFSNHPVYGIKPEWADRYCEWLSEKSELSYRLPTENEWEYAADGGMGRKFPWGNEWNKKFCNTIESLIQSTTPVGIFVEGTSKLGLMDMGGNVEEIVSSNYSPYPGGKMIVDDLAKQGPGYRITRGGGFTRFFDLARNRRRHGYFDSGLYAYGFRLASN